MPDILLHGGCQCGALRYELSGDPLAVVLCHCGMCRRAHAAPAVAWAMFEESTVRFLHGQPSTHASSPEARRGFCPRCGTPLSFTASFLPGLIDIAIGSLDDPEALQPQMHIWHARHLSWARFDDGLPRHDGLPPLS